MMNDYEVCTIWATDRRRARPRGQGARRRAGAWPGEPTRRRRPALRGVARTRRARGRVHWREELMTPHVGTLCAPAVAPLDDSVTPD